jgi:transposase
VNPTLRNDARKLSHEALEAIRVRAVQQVLAGANADDVISALGMHRSNVFRWLQAYHAGGFAALKARKISGRPSKLNARQMQWLYRTIVGKNPMQLGFSFALWTREMIRELILKKYGVRLALSTVGRVLRDLGLTCQRPLHRAFEQNPSLVQTWLDQEFPKIRAEAKMLKAQIFFGDEAGLRSDFHAGTTWGEKGKTPVVVSTGRRHSLNMISAISPRGDLRFMVVKGGIGAKVFIGFLKRLLQGSDRPIFLVLDRHPAHVAKMTKAFVASTKGRLRVFFLPPYSPELNPDEYVWNNLKANVGRKMTTHAEEMKSRVVSHLRSLQKNPEKVRSFFRSPTTSYAMAA